MSTCTSQSTNQAILPEPAVTTGLQWKLWLYPNFDCNLKCTYCVAESSPTAPRRALSLSNIRRLIDEAMALGFQKVFFTGGEPFILTDIYDMLAYASAQMQTTVLTNAMLLRGQRLDKLCAIANENLSLQVSLDGGKPEHHDAYRGKGTWVKTVEGIQRVQSKGFRVFISTTETPANTDHLDELHTFRRSLGIPDEDHFVRPLAKRGFSQEGINVGTDTLVPEVTVTVDGVYWHPLVSPSDTDMLVSKQIFPLADAVHCIEQQVGAVAEEANSKRTEFT
ncbi:MAG: radical SAM protein [Anaerolineales bacterium]|nr:radical SAM protein [Anaerolineales bacterium]MCA9929908.1 radical SAM protein [Anaerolineales bacterium]